MYVCLSYALFIIIYVNNIYTTIKFIYVFLKIKSNFFGGETSKQRPKKKKSVAASLVTIFCPQIGVSRTGNSISSSRRYPKRHCLCFGFLQHRGSPIYEHPQVSTACEGRSSRLMM